MHIWPGTVLDSWTSALDWSQCTGETRFFLDNYSSLDIRKSKQEYFWSKEGKHYIDLRGLVDIWWGPRGFLEEEAFGQRIKQDSGVLMGKVCFLQGKGLWKAHRGMRKLKESLEEELSTILVQVVGLWEIRINRARIVMRALLRGLFFSLRDMQSHGMDF